MESKTIKLVFTIPASNRVMYLLNDKRRTHRQLIKELGEMLMKYTYIFGKDSVKLEVIEE